jgi:hypothetical protein
MTQNPPQPGEGLNNSEKHSEEPAGFFHPVHADPSSFVEINRERLHASRGIVRKMLEQMRRPKD